MSTKPLTIRRRPPVRLPPNAAARRRNAPLEADFDRQLSYVLERSDFYRRLFDVSHGRARLTAADLPGLPFTTREALLHDQIEHPPFGSYLAADPSEIMRVHRTSGTSSRPLLIALSLGDVERTLDCGAECFRTAGVRPDDLVVHCLNYCLWSGGITDHQAIARAGAGVIPFGVGNTSELLSTMQTLRPTAIHCTPSYLAKLEDRLAREFDLAPASLGLRLGLFGGEPGLQDPNFHNRIETVWGFRAVDANYGISEVLSIFGAECHARCGLHFLADSVLYAELKEPEGDEVGPIEAGAIGELVLTHRSRQCQPLVRYRTADLIEIISVDRCACGRSGPRFRVLGRVDDMIVVRGVNLYLDTIRQVVHRLNDELTGEFRFEVNRTPPITDCRLRVEARDGGTPRELKARIESALRDRLKINVPVKLLGPGSLPRTDGKTCRLERVL